MLSRSIRPSGGAQRKRLKTYAKTGAIAAAHTAAREGRTDQACGRAAAPQRGVAALTDGAGPGRSASLQPAYLWAPLSATVLGPVSRVSDMSLSGSSRKRSRTNAKKRWLGA